MLKPLHFINKKRRGIYGISPVSNPRKPCPGDFNILKGSWLRDRKGAGNPVGRFPFMDFPGCTGCLPVVLGWKILDIFRFCIVVVLEMV